MDLPDDLIELNNEKARALRAAKMRAWRAKNPEAAKKASERSLEKNRDRINQLRRDRYRENSDAILARNAVWDAKNPEKRAKIRKAYKSRHADAQRVGRSESHSRWVNLNRDHVRNYTREYERARCGRDVGFRLRKSIRNRLRLALLGGVKPHRTFDLIGCSVSQLREYLEHLFSPGMNWENWSRDGWHIDHVKPLSLFDLTDPGQLRAACHFTNLQPLWAGDNLRKHAKYAGEPQPKAG